MSWKQTVGRQEQSWRRSAMPERHDLYIAYALIQSTAKQWPDKAKIPSSELRLFWRMSWHVIILMWSIWLGTGQMQESEIYNISCGLLYLPQQFKLSMSWQDMLVADNPRIICSTGKQSALITRHDTRLYLELTTKRFELLSLIQ